MNLISITAVAFHLEDGGFWVLTGLLFLNVFSHLYTFLYSLGYQIWLLCSRWGRSNAIKRWRITSKWGRNNAKKWCSMWRNSGVLGGAWQFPSHRVLSNHWFFVADRY